MLEKYLQKISARIVKFLRTGTTIRLCHKEFNNCPTRCDLFSLLYFCRQLYMFRVLNTYRTTHMNHN